MTNTINKIDSNKLEVLSKNTFNKNYKKLTSIEKFQVDQLFVQQSFLNKLI